jgi:hypothetical protein
VVAGPSESLQLCDGGLSDRSNTAEHNDDVIRYVHSMQLEHLGGARFRSSADELSNNPKLPKFTLCW